MVELPEGMPHRIRRLPVDKRGFPVPWFVQWMDGGKLVPVGGGEPDFRVIDTAKFLKCLRTPLCWICGELMIRHRVLVIGPMCVVNSVTSEPACHRECAEYAVRACPFLARPRMRRNEKDLPAGDVAGLHIDRNPGVTCLFETRDVKPFKPGAGAGTGILFRFGKPDRVDWWREGRAATRAEILDSIDTGYPELVKLATMDGTAALAELAAKREAALTLLPR